MTHRERIDALCIEAVNLGITRLLKDLLSDAEEALARGDEHETNHCIEAMSRQIEWFADHARARRPL